MSTAVIHQQNAILQQLTHIDSAQSIEEILAALALPRRTLQRRLGELVASGQVTAIGHGPSRRYICEKASLPIVESVQSIRDYLRQPLRKRTPVGYNRAFLEAYRPNDTQYLPTDLCQNLLQRGNIALEKQVAGTYARQILNRLLIDLSWNSSRLEGNTYSLLETEQLLNFGETVEGKAAKDAQMILNHKAAIEFLVDSAEVIGFNRNTILNLHALLADNLLANVESCGRLRTIIVGITGSVYYPLSIPQQIEEYFQQVLDTAAAIHNPLEQAFFILVHLSYLQAFEDVNKRVARLAANIPLIKHNLCPLSFIDVDEQEYLEAVLAVYELNNIDLLRDMFVRAYERSIQRYGAIRQSVQPDIFRLRYRKQLSTIVHRVVTERVAVARLSKFIHTWTQQNIPVADQAHFKAMVDKELAGLHEGNIARHRVQSAEFLAWKKSSLRRR